MPAQLNVLEETHDEKTDFRPIAKTPGPGSTRRPSRRGFALVVTLSLMVLLAVVAMGLLSLSAISLRESGQDGARQVAMNNARLAMYLALGELQLHAGPDTRITAPSSVLGDDVRQAHLTGVWDSRKIDPGSPGAGATAAKLDHFRSWLCSGNPDQLKEPDYVKSAIADARMLLSKEVVSDVADETSAARVSIQNPATGKSSGGFAYAVFDEGVKTSLNLGYVKPKSSDPLAVRTGALGGGQRPGIGRIDETGSLAGSDFDLGNENGDARKLISKLVSLDGAELGYNAGSGSLGRSYHDLTTHSLGLMCDVANGGMKGDLSLIAEGSKLPTELAGKSLYEAAYGLDIASDPTWEQMIGSLNLYSGSDAGGSFLSPIRRPAIVECHRAGRLECRHGSEIRPRSSGIRVAFRSCFVPLAMLPASAQKVDIYQTTRKGDRLAVVTPAENSTAVDYSLLLDPDVSHQTLLGIGSSLTDSTAQVLSELSKEKREEVLSKGLPRMARIFR